MTCKRRRTAIRAGLNATSRNRCLRTGRRLAGNCRRQLRHPPMSGLTGGRSPRGKVAAGTMVTATCAPQGRR
eukprot:2875715-Lingulodinium_polyedra.AAC.1